MPSYVVNEWAPYFLDPLQLETGEYIAQCLHASHTDLDKCGKELNTNFIKTNYSKLI